MKLNILLTITGLILLLSACQDSANQQLIDDSKLVATVGDFKVTENYLNTYLKTKGVNEPSQQQVDQALDEIIQHLALRHQAIQKELNLPLDKQLAIEQIKHRAQAQLVLDDLLLNNPVSEADVKAEYQNIVSELKGQEYHVHHLLFEDEIQALTVLDQMADGLSFAEAEADYLSTFDQVKNVGDIGWVNIKQVPESFREPLQTMAVATVYSQVVLSQFGVHVLYLENKRAAQAPEFETVKAGILKTLENQKIDRFKQLAVIKAKVKLQQ
ncbi:MAG: peptidylprolyl isomerase [Marinicella sp.]